MADLHLIQSNNDAQDQAEFPLLTFSVEPHVGGGEAQAEGFLGTDGTSDRVAEGTDASMMLGDEPLEKECIKIEVVSQRQRRTISVDPDYNVLQVNKYSVIYRFAKVMACGFVHVLARGFHFCRQKIFKFSSSLSEPPEDIMVMITIF